MLYIHLSYQTLHVCGGKGVVRFFAFKHGVPILDTPHMFDTYDPTQKFAATPHIQIGSHHLPHTI